MLFIYISFSEKVLKVFMGGFRTATSLKWQLSDPFVCTSALVCTMTVFRIATVPHRWLLENYWHNSISPVGFKQVYFTQCFPNHYKNAKELFFFPLSTRPTRNFDASFTGMKMCILLNTKHHAESYCWVTETF